MPSAQPLKPMLFYTLAGVDKSSVRYEPPNTITGRWWSEWKPRRFTPEGVKGIKTLLEDFANCGHVPDNVVYFTKIYGPLEVSPRVGEDFRFKVSAWFACQDRFRQLWEKLRSGPGLRRRILPSDSLIAQEGEKFICSPWEFQYETANLLRLMTLELYAFDHERHKRCERPGCENAHFIATHLKQRYCSEMCANWAQREWKKRWWEERGAEIRQQKAAGRGRRNKKRVRGGGRKRFRLTNPSRLGI